MMSRQRILLVAILLATGGCATVPTGPSARVFPPPGKPFDLFQAEETTCRRWAAQQADARPEELAQHNTATGALVGTGVGAGLGALLGSVSGDAGAGAVIGGVTGLLFGAATGSDEGRLQADAAQQRYDTAYLQCMVAYGNEVQKPASYPARQRVIVVPPYRRYYAPPPQPYYPPPPEMPPPPDFR